MTWRLPAAAGTTTDPAKRVIDRWVAADYEEGRTECTRSRGVDPAGIQRLEGLGVRRAL